MFETWLTAWLLGVAAVAGVIAASWSVATYRELKREGAPGAGRIVTRLWFSPVAWLLRIGDRGGGKSARARLSVVRYALGSTRSNRGEGPKCRRNRTSSFAGEAHRTLFGDRRTAAGHRRSIHAFEPPRLHVGTPTGVLGPVNSAAWQRAPGKCPKARICWIRDLESRG
jgi:hypothetical protein